MLRVITVLLVLSVLLAAMQPIHSMLSQDHAAVGSAQTLTAPAGVNGDEVPSSLDHIEVTPSRVCLPAGESLEFFAIGYDAANNPLPECAFTWTSGVGNVNAMGLFVADTPASVIEGTVRATCGSVYGEATVAVLPETIDLTDFNLRYTDDLRPDLGAPYHEVTSEGDMAYVQSYAPVGPEDAWRKYYSGGTALAGVKLQGLPWTSRGWDVHPTTFRVTIVFSYEMYAKLGGHNSAQISVGYGQMRYLQDDNSPFTRYLTEGEASGQDCAISFETSLGGLVRTEWVNEQPERSAMIWCAVSAGADPLGPDPAYPPSEAYARASIQSITISPQGVPDQVHLVWGRLFKDEGGDKDAQGNPVYQQDTDIPIPGATVSVVGGWAEPATTDDNGIYFLAVPDGESTIEASYPLCGQNAITKQVPITVPCGNTVNMSVNYLPVNCAPSGSNYELWHEGPVFSGQQDVILVHGILPLAVVSDGHPNDYFGQLDNLLQRKKHDQYNVWQFEYEQHYKIETYADWLSTAVNQVWILGIAHATDDEARDLEAASSVDLIGFSMGGLISRQYIEDGHRAEVGKLLTIGTPHFGSAWANALYYPDAKEMRPGSRFLWDLNTKWQVMGNSFAAIGGTSWGSSDGIVDVSSASLVSPSEDGLGQTRELFWTQPYSHFSPFPENRLSEIYDANNDGDPDSKTELLGFISIFLASGSGALSQFDMNPKDFGGEPYISFCLKEMPKRDDMLNETIRVVVSNTLHTYTVRSGLGLMGTLTANSESICWFNASKDDSGEIKIFYAPGKFEVRYIDQGQSSVISKPIDNSGYGITGTVRVGLSVAPISAESGGYASAGDSGEYSKHSISIPAGTLAADTSIVISEPSSDYGLASAVDFGPDGTTFSTPAIVMVEYKDSDIPSGRDESAMRLLVWENGKWEVVPGSTVNAEDNTVSGEVSHLSLYAAGILDHQPPVAEAGGPYQGSEGSLLTLDASGSYDTDGAIVLYEWDFNNDGMFEVSSTSPSVQHTWPDNFTGTVTLRVTDNDGLTSTDTAQVTVSNVAPTAQLGPMQQPNPFFILPVVDTLSFQATYADQGAADTHTATWDFGDGTKVTGAISVGTAIATHAYSQPGPYTVTLIVTDDDGGQSTPVTLSVVVVTAKDALNIMRTYIQNLPDSAFKDFPKLRRAALLIQLRTVSMLVDLKQYRAAALLLKVAVRPEMDGTLTPAYALDDLNDWITDAQAQHNMCVMIDDVVTYLRTLA